MISVGSRAAELDDDASDLDYIAICEPAPPPADLRLQQILRWTERERINVLDDVSWEFGTTDDFVLGRTEVCVSYYSRADLRSKVEQIGAGRSQRVGFYYPTGFLAALSTSHIVYDPDGLAAEIREQTREYPPTLREAILREERGNLAYYLDRLHRAIERGDAYHTFELVGLAVNSLLQQLFATHRAYFRAPKQLARQLELLPTSLDHHWLLETVHWIATAPNTRESAELKVVRLLELREAIGREAQQ